MLELDGAAGEGGGQVLRSSLALSLATGTPFRIRRIRGGRRRPGLLRQHLTAVRAAREVSGARVEGGTHNPMAPPFEFLERAYLPLLERLGVRVRALLPTSHTRTHAEVLARFLGRGPELRDLGGGAWEVVVPGREA